MAIPEVWVRAVAWLALGLVVGVYMKWYRRYQGVWPRDGMPREIVPVFLAHVVVAVIVVIAAAVLVNTVGLRAGAPAAFVLMTLAAWGYERGYAAAAAHARARLG